MTSTPLLLLAAALSIVPQTNVPFHRGPLRNSFASAAEDVIDTADTVQIHADDTEFSAQMQQVRTAYDRLKSMAEDQRETDVSQALNDMIFAISACHITARGGDSTQQCEEQVNHARTRSMEAIEKHKTPGGWQDGAPKE
ncbi:hypothetical protein SAMN05421819_1716 [Bryocella elongata]|uniref:Uncharacterized protein n=1 Tax=Bryocella elongata TaxID=863522 RepID=A0A1H5WSN4_9BACT|nr:hypothetical protein [Bryocella elongata]SEG02176.1 hypothetical protein SAMN05421819_1716 [Bryocella elongata]